MDIVRFKGGLGNQMFQYAFLKALSSKGRIVKGSLGFYEKNPDLASFTLKDVFMNVSFDAVREEEFERINDDWKEIKKDTDKRVVFEEDIKNRFFWVEKSGGVCDMRVFQTQNCVFVGYWQTEKYFSDIRAMLLKDFEFYRGEKKLELLRKQLLGSSQYISIHIRRGDYVNCQKEYGNLSETAYYFEAMQYMKEKIPHPIFVFFSDDMQWVKEFFGDKEGIYIEQSMFENYYDWYDMCLMSCCAHNIIANSTFSWWGAWLNQREDKTVIAPKTWFIKEQRPDMCPKEWVRI